VKEGVGGATKKNPPSARAGQERAFSGRTRKFQISDLGFGFGSELGFRICFGFRISCFGFRVFRTACDRKKTKKGRRQSPLCRAAPKVLFFSPKVEDTPR
jgi:hypothetical protein